MTHHFPGASLDTIVHLNYIRQSQEPPRLPEPTLEEIFTDVCLACAVDPIDMKKDGRGKREIAMVKKIFCYVCEAMTSKRQFEISAMVALERSQVSLYTKDVDAYLRIKRPDFIAYWEQFTENSKIWRNK